LIHFLVIIVRDLILVYVSLFQMDNLSTIDFHSTIFINYRHSKMICLLFELCYPYQKMTKPKAWKDGQLFGVAPVRVFFTLDLDFGVLSLLSTVCFSTTWKHSYSRQDMAGTTGIFREVSLSIWASRSILLRGILQGGSTLLVIVGKLLFLYFHWEVPCRFFTFKYVFIHSFKFGFSYPFLLKLDFFILDQFGFFFIHSYRVVFLYPC